MNICSNQKLLDDQMKKILSFMSRNGFRNYVGKPLLCCLKSNSTINSSNNSTEKNDIPEIIFHLPYAGEVGEQLLKYCLKKVNCCLNSNVTFRVLHDTKKCHFPVISKIKFFMTKGTSLFIKSIVLVAMAVI